MAWLLMGKLDLSMMLNGTLAGLVAITAGCNNVTTPSSILIGALGGVLVVIAVPFFDRLKVDDPVGALSVHLVNGIWGTLAVGIFSTSTGALYGFGFKHLGIQALGIVGTGAFTVVAAYMAFAAVRAVMGLRVSPEEEIEGLDIGEHGMEAYYIEKSGTLTHSVEAGSAGAQSHVGSRVPVLDVRS